MPDLFSNPAIIAALAGAIGAVATVVLNVAVNSRDASLRWRTSEQDRLWAEQANLRTALALEIERLRRDRVEETGRFQTMVRDLQARAEDLELRLGERDARIATLEREVDARDARVASLERDVGRLRIDMNGGALNGK